MITAVVGSGGKTSWIKETAARCRTEGKRVFVTTTTHMFKEADTLCTEDADVLIAQLNETGFVMAGTDQGAKIAALPQDVYEKVCRHADVVLIEADGSKHMPFKFPNAAEPVIPDNADEIKVICGLHALGQKAIDCCHRLELVKACLQIEDHTIITPSHVQMLVTKGYLQPLRKRYPHLRVSLTARHDGSLYQRALAALLEQEQDVTLLKPEWFAPQPKLILCGGGHVAKEVAAMASLLDFNTRVIDDRAEIMTAERFPHTEEIICDSYENIEHYLEPNACYVIVTPDYKADYRCVSAILPTTFSYLGMIGSKRKVAAAKQKLIEDGFSDEQISRIFAPIGLPIGAVTPAEIAVSIFAQIIQEKNKNHTASADRTLLNCKDSGVLCVIIQKEGSAPRGVGSMMLVTEHTVLGSIGGGESENHAIELARTLDTVLLKEYQLNNKHNDGLDMVCGGTIQVLFLPV